MSLMKTLQGILVLCLPMDLCAAQTSTPNVSLDSLRFLIGESLAHPLQFTFAFDLQNKVIVRKNDAQYLRQRLGPRQDTMT